MAARALPLPDSHTVLVVLDGGLTANAPIQITDHIAVENAWIELQVVAHEAETFISLAVDAARRMQVAIARGLPGLAGQYAHDLEVAGPRYALRARRAELEAQDAIKRLHPERPA